jgi:hypothetical protein
MRCKRTQILPTSECQVRPVTKLELKEQPTAWQMAVEEAGREISSGRIVKEIVQCIKKTMKVLNPYNV